MDKALINEQNARNAAVKKMSPREKALKQPTSAKLAIAAYCYHDCHNELSINSHITKRAIGNCPTQECALWLHRGWKNLK